jgi:hypothetical protein
MTQIRRELLIFVAIPIVYPVCFFGWCYLAEKMPIFSKRNARSSSTVACGHITVLLILILLSQIAFQIYAFLPDWLTDQIIVARGGKHSVFEILCIVFSVAIGAIEKRWVYIDSDVDNSGS